MARKIRLKPAARNDLAAIHGWTWQKFGSAQADAYVTEVHDTFMLLANNPGVARNASRIRPGLVSYPSGSHMIYARIDGEAVTIVRILHGRMDPERWV